MGVSHGVPWKAVLTTLNFHDRPLYTPVLSDPIGVFTISL